VLGAGLLEHRDALAQGQVDAAQVDAQLHVEPLGRMLLDRARDADARVVDQHVEPPVALAVGVDDLLDALLVAHVRGDGMGVQALVGERLDRILELLRAPGRDRQPVPLLAQHAGDREADPAGSSGHQCGTALHSLSSSSDGDHSPRAVRHPTALLGWSVSVRFIADGAWSFPASAAPLAVRAGPGRTAARLGLRRRR
jgi:hypothetical protein